MDPINLLDNKSFLFTFWKPLLGYSYIVIILFDFIIAPILMPELYHILGYPPSIWIPLTTSYGGVLHLSVAGILGATAWTHGMADVEAMRNMPDYSNIPTDQPQNGGVNIQVNQQPLKHRHADIDIPPENEIKN